ALHAGLHGLPQLAQAGLDLLRAAPAAFVLEHHPGDAQPALPRPRQQLVAAGERIRHAGGVGDDPVFGRLVLVDHEAAPDRVVIAAGDFVALGIVGGKAHAVGVIGQLVALVHQQVALLVERDPVAAVQLDLAAAADAFQRAGDHVG